MAISLSSSCLSVPVTVGASYHGSPAASWNSRLTCIHGHELSGIRISRKTAERRTSRVFAAADGAEVATAEKLTEVTKDTFYPALEAAGDKLVVLDMYTQWCGPCKMLEPKIQALVPQYTDVVFLKLDCNQDNKPLAKELGIRVVPTFKLFRYKELVGEVVGAKYDVLLSEINKWRATE